MIFSALQQSKVIRSPKFIIRRQILHIRYFTSEIPRRQFFTRRLSSIHFGDECNHQQKRIFDKNNNIQDNIFMKYSPSESEIVQTQDPEKVLASKALFFTGPALM